MKTYSAKTGEIKRDWYVVDAEGQNLGRLASVIAETLRGKRSPFYTPHADCGDFVVVVNAEKIAVTGQKMDEKLYWRHSGYPGGLKTTDAQQLFKKDPTELLVRAIEGMLPKTPLGNGMAKKLRVYVGPNHPHQAQHPEPISL